jgi:N-methylhydantoinase B/oxoprolinase/acetone carboxylase alpha subunit
LYSGGDGQRIGFRMRTGRDWLLNAIPSRLHARAQGLMGGQPGAAGMFLINGEPNLAAHKRAMESNDEILMQTPGGGGFGPSSGAARDAAGSSQGDADLPQVPDRGDGRVIHTPE